MEFRNIHQFASIGFVISGPGFMNTVRKFNWLEENFGALMYSARGIGA